MALFEAEQDFLARLVTEDETWVYIYDRKTKTFKRMASQWVSAAEEASVFWDKDSILLVDCLHPACSITVQYHANVLDQLTELIKNKHPGKLIEGHDNAAAHTSMLLLTN